MPPPAPEAVAERPAKRARKTSRRQAQPREAVDVLQGQAVSREVNGIQGLPGYYGRLCVTCPYHKAEGKRICKRNRGTAAAQTAMLGEKEPLAYLGAWLVMGRSLDFDTIEKHVACQPSEAQVREYARERGWC